LLDADKLWVGNAFRNSFGNSPIRDAASCPTFFRGDLQLSAKYLLPCPCGQTVLVEPKQAGAAVTCGCGNVLAVPTVLQMASLELAAPAARPSSAKTRWGARQRLILLGVVILAGAVALAGWSLYKRPLAAADLIDPATIRQNVQKFTLWQTWEAWERFKSGLDPRKSQRYNDALQQFYIALGASAILAAMGIALVAFGIRKDISGKQRRTGV
jgi:hypothetical protein